VSVPDQKQVQLNGFINKQINQTFKKRARKKKSWLEVVIVSGKTELFKSTQIK
jgi:hypothetical protein